MNAVFGLLLFLGVVIFLVWNVVKMVQDFKGRKKQKDVKTPPSENDKDK